MKCKKVVNELFRARDIVHLEHLYSEKWGEHVILDDLYTQLLDSADTIAELLLSRKKVKFTIDRVDDVPDIVHYLKHTLVPILDSGKESADDHGFNDISAELDVAKVNVQKAIYKLKRLTDSHKKHGKEKKEGHEHEHGDGIEEYMEERMHNGGVLYGKKDRVPKKGKEPLTKR